MTPYRLGLLEHSKFDRLLLDTAVNEQAAAEAGLHNSELSSNLFRSTIAWCVERRVTPLLLVIPLMTSAERYLFGDGQIPEVLAQYRRLSDEHNVRMIDGYALAANLCRNRPLSHLFDDAHHPALNMQAVIAREVARAALEKPAKVKLKHARRARFVPASGMAGVRAEQIVKRTSAIADVDLVRLEVGDRLTADLRSGSEVAGVVFNMLAASAALSICGRTKRLDCCQPSPIPLRLVTWTMSQTVRIFGKTQLECVALEGRDAEANEHNFPDCIPKPDPLEFAGLIILDSAFTPVNLSWCERLLRLLNRLRRSRPKIH